MEKSALIKALLSGENPNKETYIFVVEFQRFNNIIGFGKFEVLDHKQGVKFKAKLQLDLRKQDNIQYFANLKNGEHSVQVGMVQMESKTFFKTLN